MANIHRPSRERSSSLQKEIGVTSVLGETPRIPNVGGNATVDDQTLGALGYKQEFKR